MVSRTGNRPVFLCFPAISQNKKFYENEVYDYIDVAFPIVHGTNVEDGTLQGYLKMFNLPYVGCDVTSSAVGMDKYVSKTILKENNIPVYYAQENE